MPKNWIAALVALGLCFCGSARSAERLFRNAMFTCIPIGAPVPQLTLWGKIASINRSSRSSDCTASGTLLHNEEQQLSFNANPRGRRYWLNSESQIFELKKYAFERLNVGDNVSVIADLRDGYPEPLAVLLLPPGSNSNGISKWVGPKKRSVVSGRISDIATGSKPLISVAFVSRGKPEATASSEMKFKMSPKVPILAVSATSDVSGFVGRPVMAFVEKDICDCAWEVYKLFVSPDGIMLPN